MPDDQRVDAAKPEELPLRARLEAFAEREDLFAQQLRDAAQALAPRAHREDAIAEEVDRRVVEEAHQEAEVEEERAEHEPRERLDAVDVPALLLGRVHHLEDPQAAPGQGEHLDPVPPLAGHSRVVDAMDPLELVPVPDLDPLGQIIGVGRGDETDAIPEGAGRDVSTEQLLRAGEPHIEVVVAREIRQPSPGLGEELA